ncbi:glycine zipper family protein [Roseococcus pinisoli]|uniref:Glycine zipper family protein n=1 Tax=Roseococcus pinisoli TaxID=2835040 RepID=A0ABS5Q9C4_9PROT|nr:glycine zipper family protein [Roseococcus pinisoli]MBS7810114.1 glycine zipper family protein [Roseococcus pinisoli]
MKKLLLLGAAGLGLVGCAATPPSGPTVIALPPQGKDFAQFQREDQTCQMNAAASIGYANPSAAATNAAVGSAVAGTAVGAAAGALVGAAAGNPGAGAAIGAGAGLVTGTAVGANAAAGTTYEMQGRFDVTYAQCMTALGNTVQTAPAVPPAVPYYATPYYPYAYPYAAYGYPYAYPYFAPSIGIYGGWGWGGYRGGWGGYRGGWGYGGGWGYRGGYRGGWHR